MSPTSTLADRRTDPRRIDRLVARVRHRQLVTALRGRFAESFHYARWVARLRRAVSAMRRGVTV
jgi:hypothetical protein